MCIPTDFCKRKRQKEPTKQEDEHPVHPEAEVEAVTLVALFQDSSLVIVFDHVLTNLGIGDLLRLEIPIN